MTSEQQKNIFRLAAIIFGRSSKGVSLNKTHQRIVDDALFCCGKKSISLTNLIIYIKTNYGLFYTTKEIIDLVKGRGAEEKYQTYTERDDMVISLTVEYKNKLSSLSKEKTLYDYIDEYFVLQGGEDVQGKELILRFLYEMFTSNLEGYKLILQEKFNAVAAGSNFNDEEKAIINGFLNWPNDNKNKAVYDLAGYALEYCMMTNKKNTSLNTQNLKNKSFYIDTNIIYRAIGLNGDGFKTRAHLFLSKFKEVGEKLVVSQSTYVEFVDSVDYYIEKIENSQNPRVNTKVLMQFIDENSVFLYYCKWRVGRVNRGPGYFKDWIMSEFNSLCDQYDIVRETKYPYNRELLEKELNEMSSSIHECDTDKPYTSAVYDAENVLWVEEKRKGSGDDIYQAKSFLLSSDNSLRRWDYHRNTNRVPIVMSPSQWLGIILHYVERTSNDYQSFVSFLTLSIRHEVWPIEKLSLVITGISQTTSDIEMQQHLVRNFIERKVFDEVESMNDEELEKEAETFAKTELDKRIDRLEKKRRYSKRSLAKMQLALSATKKELDDIKKFNKDEVAKINEKLNAVSEEKKQVESQNADLLVKIQRHDLYKWRSLKVVYGVVISLIAIMLCLMVFHWRDANWNFVYKFVQYLDGEKDSVAFSLGQAIIVIPLSVIVYGGWMVKDAFDVDEYDKKKCRFFWASKS